MKINVKYFASIREALGTGAETLDTATRDVAGLRDELIARGGVYAASLARGKAVRVAINQTLAEETAPLVEGAEVAFFPPVTGG